MDEKLWEINDKLKWRELNLKLLHLFKVRPECIVWENITDDKLDFWINLSLEEEEYEVASLFKNEKIKRKLPL